MSNQINLIISMDLGNGFIKGYIHGNDKPFIIPSRVAIPNDESKNDSEKEAESNKPEYIENYSKYMDEIVTSSTLNDRNNNKRLLIGANAENENKEGAYGFNPQRKSSKSEDDLSIILIDGVIASKAIEYYANKYHKAPENDITVNVGLVTALPIEEGKRPGATERYEKRFTNNSHDVKACNISSNKDIKIHINFSKAYVYLEDAISIFKIREDASSSMKNSISKDIKSQMENQKGSAGKYWQDNNNMPYEKLLKKLPNSLAIDVGQKTTDLALLNGETPSNNSRSIYYGLGSIIDQAIDDGNFSHNDPVSFIHLLLEDASGLSDEMKEQKLAWKYVKQESQNLLVKINQPIQTILSNNRVDAIYVYGGGSIILKSLLQKELQEELSQMGKHEPIVFIDKHYAQYMNLLGLRSAADTLIGANQL